MLPPHTGRVGRSLGHELRATHPQRFSVRCNKELDIGLASLYPEETTCDHPGEGRAE